MNKIITISREFGSGGREIGKRLADELNFAYYDKELITKLAQETGMSEEYIKNISEKGIYPINFHFARSFNLYSTIQKQQTEIMVAEQNVLKRIAQEGNCVIVGRGANTILKEYNPVNLFVYADMDSKIERCKGKRKDEIISEKEIEKKIKQIDKNRMEYQNIIFNNKWGEKENYHLCINTSGLEIKKIIPSLASYIEKYWSDKK